MHAPPREAAALASAIAHGVTPFTHVEVAVAPPFISLSAVRHALEGSAVRLGAQDAYWADSGAYTGAVSAAMLAGLAQYVIVGHSERRSLFGDTDQHVYKKAAAVLRHGMAAIVCVGEHLDDRDGGRTDAVVRSQIHGSLGGLEAGSFRQVVVAYEPVWAIGTGRAATAQDAADAIAIIRALLAEMYGAAAAAPVRVQYGGSVTAANAAELAAVPDVDGALVGGASLTSEFVAIARAFAENAHV
jgi:triosephosphate isomerase